MCDADSKDLDFKSLEELEGFVQAHEERMKIR